MTQTITLERVNAAKDDELAELASQLQLSPKGKPETVRKRIVRWIEASEASNKPTTDEVDAPTSSTPGGTDVPDTAAELAELKSLIGNLGGAVNNLVSGVQSIRGDVGTLATDLGEMRQRVEGLEDRPPLAVHDGGRKARPAPPRRSRPSHGRMADELQPQGMPLGAPTGASHAESTAGTRYRKADGVEPPPGAFAASHTANAPRDAAIVTTHNHTTHRVADELADNEYARGRVQPPPGAAVAKGAPRIADDRHDIRGTRLEELTGELLQLVADLRPQLDRMHPHDERRPGALQRWQNLSSIAQDLARHLADS